ncbi:GIY-YIG nuclease family protein [Mycetocola zhadangensis]|uniref:GIY-YIG nuclease family protein n=1 Tax=Mycetocola zhadangensis TaxID=1164595 RepID=UPI003A4E1C3B
MSADIDRTKSRAVRCAIETAPGDSCGSPVEFGTPLNLCEHHLLEAHEWVVRDVGVTDTLDSPCVACGSRLGVRYPSGWLCAVCEWKVGEVPDGPVLRARVDVVYYLRFRDRIKIGTSSNPRSRFGNIVHDELLGFELGGRALEQKRHAQFARYRLDSSEWFEASAELMRHIAAVTAGIDDPWLLHRRWISEKIALHN